MNGSPPKQQKKSTENIYEVPALPSSPSKRTKKMVVAYTFNNELYDDPVSVNCEISLGCERPNNVLSFYFHEDYMESTVTLSVMGRKSDKYVAKNTSQFHTMSIHLKPKNIRRWCSYPLESNVRLPEDFCLPKGYLTSEENPKRIFYIDATDAEIEDSIIPATENPQIEDVMISLAREISECISAGKLLEFKCIVNEYRSGRPAYFTIKDQIEKDLWDEVCEKCGDKGHGNMECTKPDLAEKTEDWCMECNMAGMSHFTSGSMVV